MTAETVRRRLRTLVGLTLGGLAAQYLLGMAVNLFVQVPAAHPGAGAADYLAGVGRVIGWALADGAVVLRLHVALGLLLLLAGAAILAAALASGARAWIWAAAVGLGGLTGAAFNGASFLNYNHGFSSYIMAASFLLALTAYAIGIHVTR